MHLERKVCLGVFISLLVCSLIALGQETTAGIQGTVKDPQGAVIPGATVEVASPALIGKKSAVTDAGGYYRIEHLPPGVYNVTVNATGFAPQTQSGLQLSTGALPSINFSMNIGGVTQEVSVTAEAVAVAIDMTQSKVATTVTEEVLTALPKTRSFQSLIPFAPGARQEPLQGGRDGNRTNGFQIDGAADGENVYLIDGINTTDIQNGGVGKNFQADFIQEVQIKSSSFEAEFGGALGGVINAVPKRGSNAWHGEVKTYYESAALDATDPCNSGFTASGGNLYAGTSFNAYNTLGRVCGQRLNPSLPQLNSSQRLDGTPEYYVPKKDSRHILTPGYELGGPLVSDRLWLFSSYVPALDSTQRTTTFQCPTSNPNCGFAGPRRLSQDVTTHNAYNRLDYRLSDRLRLAGSWNYGYSRTIGQLAFPDSAYGQVNTGATTDPGTLRPDNGQVRPLSVYSVNGDWTPTSKLLVSARYGYFFSNVSTRGTPTGIRYIYDRTVNANSRDVNNDPFPSNTPFNTDGFSNIPNNFTTIFDAFKRKSFNADVSYLTGNWFGNHNFKAGYMWQTQYNNVNISAITAVVDLFWGDSYTPSTSTTACATIQATNSRGLCQGQFGYFVVGSLTTSNNGFANAKDQALYFQDAWNVGRSGLTLNLGVRLDHEINPAYDPARFPNIDFGWGKKVAPRLGGAYDLLHNGKVKIFGDYSKYFDIMKLGLTRGSFGSDYWHECVYALDTVDYTAITPTLNFGAGCPRTGPAPGVNGRFIENTDLRATKEDPRDPAVQVKMKPVESHSLTAGADWAISSKLTFESRYTRKRLDQTIEDMSITDNLGYYIGNPGTTYADVLHRPTVIPDANNNNYFNTVPFCAECPHAVKPIRRYDGLELRMTYRGTSRWFGTVSYLWSRLTGNYSGLTDTDPTDGNGGRHSPNNGRAFDIPTMTYLPSGKIDDGPLSTDRPHTAKVFGTYRLPWFGGETLFGVSQAFYEGTPIGSCLGVLGVNSPDSACQWAEGRGNFAKLHRDPATGNIVKDGVIMHARTEPFFQTDLSIRHEIRVNKNNENYRLVIEGNANNLLNQHAATSVYEYIHPSNHISPTRTSRFSGDPQIDWGKLMNGYNYIDALNATGSFANVQQSAIPLASRYGLPWTFQIARQFRFAVRFVF